MRHESPIIPINPAIRARRPGQPPVIPRGIPRARLQASQPSALGGEQGQYIRLPGANFPPAGAIPVDVMGDSNLGPAATGVIVTYTVPDTLRFRLAGIGFGSDDPAALGFLSWAIQLDQISQPGYVGVSSAVGSLRNLAEIFQLVASSQTLTILATIDPNAVIVYRYICRIRGWLYSEKESG